MREFLKWLSWDECSAYNLRLELVDDLFVFIKTSSKLNALIYCAENFTHIFDLVLR